MLCAKFGSGQSSNCPVQSSNPSIVQQSSDCSRNPQIAPNEVRKVWMKGNPLIACVTLSSYCRQVICWSRTYCTRIAHIKLSSYCRLVIHQTRTSHTRKSRADKSWSKVGGAGKSRTKLGKIQQRHLDRKSIVTLFHNSESVHAPTVNTTVDTDGKPRDFTQNLKWASFAGVAPDKKDFTCSPWLCVSTLLPTCFPDRKVSFVHFPKTSLCAILQLAYTSHMNCSMSVHVHNFSSVWATGNECTRVL